jgi:hypothetical protein
MPEVNSSRGRGRSAKDPALRLRDRYWALNLKSSLPGESFASIERRIAPHLRVSRREFGQGFSQPFALSKVASGSRGISAFVDGTPDVVRRAEQWVAGSSGAFTSLLWRTLLPDATWQSVWSGVEGLSEDVSRRLMPRHLQSTGVGVACLNEAGVRRVSRLAHVDAIGLLLARSPRISGITHEALAAEDCVGLVLRRVCAVDAALRQVEVPLRQLIKERFPQVPIDGQAGDTRAFTSRRVSGIRLGLRRLLGA